jgi:molybdate transport system substrate-binding protein
MFRTLRLALTAATTAFALLLPAGAAAGEVKIAVAANFTAAANDLAAAFTAATGHTAVLSFGSTGKL